MHIDIFIKTGATKSKRSLLDKIEPQFNAAHLLTSVPSGRMSAFILWFFGLSAFFALAV